MGDKERSFTVALVGGGGTNEENIIENFSVFSKGGPRTFLPPPALPGSATLPSSIKVDDHVARGR